MPPPGLSLLQLKCHSGGMRKEGTFRETLLYPQKILQLFLVSMGLSMSPTSECRRGMAYLLTVKATSIHTWGYFAIFFPPCHRTEEGHLIP